MWGPGWGGPGWGPGWDDGYYDDGYYGHRVITVPSAAPRVRLPRGPALLRLRRLRVARRRRRADEGRGADGPREALPRGAPRAPRDGARDARPRDDARAPRRALIALEADTGLGPGLARRIRRSTHSPQLALQGSQIGRSGAADKT